MKMLSPQLRRLSLIGSVLFVMLIIGQKIQAEPAMQASASPSMLNHGDESPALPVGSTPTATYSWETRVIEDVKTFATLHPQALQVDSHGRPHIVYGGDQLYYAWSSGITWYHETIDATDGVGGGAILVLDSTNTPHVLYRHSATANLLYAQKVNGTWLIETVALSADYSLALDNQDRPHIAYIDASGTLTHAYRQANTWITEEVPADAGYGVSLAVDSQSKPHITVAKAEGSNFEIRYIHQTSSDWVIETIPMPSYVGLTILTLTDDDQPRIGARTDDLFIENYYIYPGNNEWVVEPIRSSTSTIYNMYFYAMILDSQGEPHVLVTGIEPGWGYRVYYLERVAGVWVQKNINIIPENGHGYSLALDTNDQPHIAYYRASPPSCNDCGEKILTYEYQIGAAWQTEFIDIGGINTAVRSAMALDNEGNMHIVYSAARKVRYARWAGGRWELETIEANTSYIDSGLSQLIIDNYNRSHFLYYDYEDNTLKYAFRNAGTWVVHVVAHNVSLYSFSLAVNDEGEPAIIYANQGDNYDGVHYAFRDGTSWIDEMVVSDGAVGSNLVLNSSGTPHFALYLDNAMYYAWRTPTGWQSEVIASAPNTSYSCHSLVLDSNEQPHMLCTISDRDYGHDDRRHTYYTYKQDNNWVLEHLLLRDGTSSVSSDALILDSENNPHIALVHRDSTKYFHKADGNWELTEFFYCCYHMSLYGLFLDALDQPHLAYSDTIAARHQYKVGGTWMEELIPEMAENYRAVMLEDENGMPFFTYTDSWESVQYGSNPGQLVSVRHTLKTVSEVIPVAGGTITTPDGTTTLVFPSGAFSNTVQVTLTFTDTFIRQGDLWGNGYDVAITAVDANTNEPISLLPGQTYTMSVMYRHYPPAREESLAFYTWNGAQWEAETSSVLQMPNHLIMTAPDHLGQFAILGDTLTTYFPVILHYPLRE